MTTATPTHDAARSGGGRPSRLRGRALGAVAAACAVCCAAPVLALLGIGATGAAAAALTAVFAGLTSGLVVAAATLATMAFRRRQARLAARSPGAASSATGPVLVELRPGAQWNNGEVTPPAP